MFNDFKKALKRLGFTDYEIMFLWQSHNVYIQQRSNECFYEGLTPYPAQNKKCEDLETIELQ